MRTARIKLPSTEVAALYHCMSRTVAGEFLLDHADKERIRELVWLMADASGVQVLSYAILDNHLHILVLVPHTLDVPDAELLRRFRLRRPKPTRYDVAQLEAIASDLAANRPAGIAWRRRQRALMGDISQYMKVLKQKITAWYNHTHRRYGTLWSERFTSVLVQSEAQLAQILAMYVDLNPVRANLVNDPKDYRFCSYAEAVAGSQSARSGIQFVTGIPTWPEAHAAYRVAMFGTATVSRRGRRALPTADFERVARAGGRLSLREILFCRNRYLTGTLILGSQAFVAAHLKAFLPQCPFRRSSEPTLLPAVTGVAPLAAARALRGRVFGPRDNERNEAAGVHRGV